MKTVFAHFFAFHMILVSFNVKTTEITGSTSIRTVQTVSKSDTSKENTKVKYDELKSQIDQIRGNQQNQLNELAKQNIETANRIIDWSAMIFTALAILLVIAGGIGLREFSKIRQIEENMKKMLELVKNELDEIQKYKTEIAKELPKIQEQRTNIIQEMKVFTEITYSLNDGIQAFDSGNYVKAREFLNKVIKLKSDHTIALYFIGKSFRMENDMIEAISYFEKIIRIDPKSSLGYDGMASCYITSDPEKAIQYCNQAIELDSKSISALLYLGQIHRNLEKFDDAFHYYHRAQRIKPKLFTAHFYIGLLHYAQSDFDAADTYFKKAYIFADEQIKKFQYRHWAYYVMAVIDSLIGNLKKARNHLEKALSYNPATGVRISMKDHLSFLLRFSDNNRNINSMFTYLTKNQNLVIKK